MEKIKVVFMGTPEFATRPLEVLINNYDVVAVVTQPDKAGNRGKVIYSPVKQLALDKAIKVLQPEKIRSNYQAVLDTNADVIVTCAYGQIIPKEILDAPKYGCINIHASLLPKLRGGAPIHRSIINGEEKTGVTIMYMDEKMDEGDMICAKEVVITDSDTVGTIHDKLSEVGAALIKETLPKIIAGTNERHGQDHSQATYAYNLKKEDELVDFNKPARQVFNQIRGLNPFPGAYAILDGKVIKFYELELSDRASSTTGIITDIEDDKMFVSCLDYDIIIKEIKYEGSRKMTVKEFFNGRSKADFIGKVFNGK